MVFAAAGDRGTQPGQLGDALTASGLLILTTPEGQTLLESLPPYDPGTVDRVSRRLRAEGVDPGLIAAALTQQRLRLQGETKFGERAADMLFTRDGLQQATRPSVAALHAQRYVDAGCSRVADITCGIGAESLALARAGLEVTAVDLDPETAACAAHNLRDFPGATVLVEDGLTLNWEDFDGIFADPARRSARGRTFNPADYSPPLNRVLALRSQVPALGVKIAPGIGYEHLPQEAQAQWVSVDGQVVEAGLWFGPLAASPGRSALVIKDGEIVEITASDNPRAPVVAMEAAPLGEFLYEPDGAVIRSGGLEVAAQLLGAAPVSADIAYLSGPGLVLTPLAQAFEVVEAMPLKQLRGYVRDRRIGSLEILKRGVDVVPDQLRKSLKLRGTESATVILTRLLGRHSAIVVRRVSAVT